MADTIAKGAVVIGANTAGLESGLKQAQTKIAAFQTKITENFSFIGTGPMAQALSVGRVAFDYIKGQFDEISQLGDKAESIMNSAAAFGMSTKQFQEISQVAELAGVSIAELEKGFKHMADTVVESQLGDEAAIKKLRMIGLKPENLVGKSTTEAFDAIGAAIAKIEDPMLRVKAATDIFGKSGMRLLPILTENTEKARAFQSQIGAVWPDSTSEQLDAAADSIKNLGNAWSGLNANIKASMAWKYNLWSHNAALAVGKVNAAMYGKNETATGKPGKTGNDIVAAALAEAQAKLGQQQADDYDKWIKDVAASGKDLESQAQAMVKTWGLGANAVKVYALEMKGLAGEQLKAAESAATLMDNMNAAKGLFQENPADLIRQQMAGIDGIFMAGAGIEARFAAMGQLAQNTIAKAGLGQSRSVSAMVAGSNEDIRGRIQAQMDMQAGSPADQLQAALKELSRKYDAQVQLGRESRDFLKKIADRAPVEIDAR